MFANRRTTLIAVAAAAFLAACSQADVKATDEADMSLGPADAKVHLIEYADVACPVCREVHNRIWETLKSEFIDTGKVRFTMREYAVHAQYSLAGFQVVRCGEVDAEEYFRRVTRMFHQQDELFGGGQIPFRSSVRALQEFAKEDNLSDSQVNSCIEDEAGAARVTRVMEEAGSKVSGTPTFFLNGRLIDTGRVASPEALRQTINEALGGS